MGLKWPSVCHKIDDEHRLKVLNVHTPAAAILLFDHYHAADSTVYKFLEFPCGDSI